MKKYKENSTKNRRRNQWRIEGEHNEEKKKKKIKNKRTNIKKG